MNTLRHGVCALLGLLLLSLFGADAGAVDVNKYPQTIGSGAFVTRDYLDVTIRTTFGADCPAGTYYMTKGPDTQTATKTTPLGQTQVIEFTYAVDPGNYVDGPLALWYAFTSYQRFVGSTVYTGTVSVSNMFATIKTVLYAGQVGTRVAQTVEIKVGEPEDETVYLKLKVQNYTASAKSLTFHADGGTVNTAPSFVGRPGGPGVDYQVPGISYDDHQFSGPHGKVIHYIWQTPSGATVAEGNITIGDGPLELNYVIPFSPEGPIETENPPDPDPDPDPDPTPPTPPTPGAGGTPAPAPTNPPTYAPPAAPGAPGYSPPPSAAGNGGGSSGPGGVSNPNDFYAPMRKATEDALASQKMTGDVNVMNPNDFYSPVLQALNDSGGVPPILTPRAAGALYVPKGGSIFPSEAMATPEVGQLHTALSDTMAGGKALGALVKGALPGQLTVNATGASSAALVFPVKVGDFSGDIDLTPYLGPLGWVRQFLKFFLTIFFWFQYVRAVKGASAG